MSRRSGLAARLLLLALLVLGLFVDSSSADALAAIPAYNENVAQICAEYCGAAYACGMSGGHCKGWQCPTCRLHPNAEIIRFKSTTEDSVASGFVAYDPDIEAIIIAFSGTRVTDVENWVSNADSVLVDLPVCEGCAVHEGFLRSYQAVAPQVFEALTYVTTRVPDLDIWITGHSQGGALAILCALDLQTNHTVAPKLVYTMGQPRLGNPAFAASLRTLLPTTALYRLVHDQDPVPHIPPMLLGFQHAPTEIFYNEDESSYKICNASGEDFTCSDRYLFTFNTAHHLSYLGVAM